MQIDTTLLEMFFKAPLIASFLAGILSFLSPCILPLIPAYMSYISGATLDELKNGKLNRSIIFAKSLAFVLGFSMVFMVVGMALQSVIHLVRSPIVQYICGGVVIVFGLHFLGVFRLKWLYTTKRFDFEWKAFKCIAPFVLGMSFALGWTPCTGPVFGAIVLAGGANAQYGSFLLGLYTFGLALPFLILSFVLERGLEVLGRFRKYMRVIEIISGILLIIIGVLIACGSLDALNLSS